MTLKHRLLQNHWATKNVTKHPRVKGIHEGSDNSYIGKVR